jgi:hypothetical protein
MICSEDKDAMLKIFNASGRDVDFLSKVMESMAAAAEAAEAPAAAVTKRVWKDRKTYKAVGGAAGNKAVGGAGNKAVGGAGGGAGDAGGGAGGGGGGAGGEASADGADGADGEAGAGGGANYRQVEVDEEGFVLNCDKIDPKQVNINDVCLQGLFGSCEKCGDGKCRKIQGPRGFLYKVLKGSKYNRNIVAKFLGKTVEKTLEMIDQFAEMSEEEFAFASQVNSVCFFTASSRCKNVNCRKNFCGGEHYNTIKEIILGSIIGIQRFASFMKFDTLEMVADHFEVEVEDIPVLVKYLAKYLAEEPDV